MIGISTGDMRSHRDDRDAGSAIQSQSPRTADSYCVSINAFAIVDSS